MTKGTEIVGATIAGKYMVRRIVGAGSMGVVCEAEHVEIGKRVAIKLIDASLSGMADIAARFRQEARACSLVESQHIVQVFDVGTDPQLGLYLVMEYLTGEDLAAVLAREKCLPVERAVRIAVRVARGLGKAHEAGIVHRDLKPANIFLGRGEDDEPIVKILDFGISKVLHAARSTLSPGLKVTRDGVVVGTPQYMSPEQAQGLLVDERTDIWALGLVLYEMLAGRPAYPELPTYEQFIIHLVSKPPDLLREVAPWVPEHVASIVHLAIEHDLAKRIQSSSDLIRRLDGPIEAVYADSRSELARSGESAERRSPPPDPSALTSGIRRTTAEPPAFDDDFREDAPQLFDRKAFRALNQSPAVFHQGPSLAIAECVSAPSSTTEARAPPIARRLYGQWTGLALLILALAAAAAIAWR